MWKYNYGDELYHFGVKGMKWGVRRARNKEQKEAYKRHQQFQKDYHSGKVKKAKGNYESVVDQYRATINSDPNRKRDAELANAYETRIGKEAVGVVLAAMAGVTVSMLMNGPKK